MGTIKVLIAEDETIVADILTKKLRQAGYDVVTTYDGNQAWEKINQEFPDIVLLDLTMPGLSGWQVMEKLRENPPTKQWIPVIIVSAHQDIEHIQRSLTMQAAHYLTKPCKTEDILQGIRTALTLASMRTTP